MTEELLMFLASPLTLETILNPRFESALMKLRTLSNLLATSAILRIPL